MNIAFKKISSPVAYCALSVKVGTRDEDAALNGIAHFTEHMIFKGTKTRSASAVNNYLEKYGGELNAYTTKEETVVYATVLKEDLPKAVELLSDLVFNSTFPQKELIKEREVILEEISSYKDSPAELIFDDFEEHAFGKHPLAKPILGTRESVRHITSDDIHKFTSQHYKPDNMSFAIVADITEEKAVKLVHKWFGTNNDKIIDREESFNVPVVKDAQMRFKVIPKKTHQAHCVIGTTAYTLYQQERIPLALLTNILGGPALNSSLNRVLREKYGLAYNIDATYTPYHDTGLFTIYFGTDKNNIEKCLELVDKELNKLIEKELTMYQLKAARKQLLGQLAISVDNPESQCLSMGKSMLVYGKVESIEAIAGKIMQITPQMLKNVANEIFAADRMYTLIYR